MKKIMGSPLLFMMLSFVYPASLLLEVNRHIYTTDQIIVTLVFVLLVSIITTLAVGISVTYFVKVTLLVASKCGLKKDFMSISSKLYRALLGASGIIILHILLFSATRELLYHDVFLLIYYIITTFCVFVLAYYVGLKYFNFILCALLLFNCILLVKNDFWSESLKLHDSKMLQEVVFKQKPNVYLVILESYASLDIRKETYNIDNVPLTRELKFNNYDMYKCYSNYAGTLPSVASVFLMDHHYYKLSRGIADGGGYRKIIGGVAGNRVINIFLNNGYRIDYNKFNKDLYHPSSDIEVQEIQPLLQPIEVFSVFFTGYRQITQNSLWSSEIVQSFLWLPEKISGKSSKIVKNGKTKNERRPVFSVIYHDGATHSSSRFSQLPPEIRNMPGVHQMPPWQINHVNDYWTTTYKRMVAKSDIALIERVKDLAEKDPGAIVILLGDHGPFFHLYRWMGGGDNLNDNMLGNGIQPAEVTRDYFEVFMAIKWPNGTKKSHEYFSPVNLFRHVFAVLTKDKSILKKQVANKSFILASNAASYPNKSKQDLYCLVKESKLLDRWEPFPIPAAQ